MAYDYTTFYIAYEYHHREYQLHEMMDESMEYVRRPTPCKRRIELGGICTVCSTLKRPTELVDGRAYRCFAVICLRCALPPCEKCGDKAWAWELLQGGCGPAHAVGEWFDFDSQGNRKDLQFGPEGNQLPDEVTGSLLRQLCLQGISWEEFRKKALEQHVSPASHMLCPLCKKERFCGRCQKNLREVDFDKDCRGRLYTVCRACQHPTCSICGTTRASIWTPSPKEEKPVALCDACESKRTCGRCERRLDLDAFDRKSNRNIYKYCRECQYPVCDLCGQKRKSIWTPNPKAVNAPPLCESCESKSAGRKRK